MIVQKSEIAPKLSKLKTIVPSKISTEGNQCIQGILYKNNSLQATNLEISIKAAFEKGEEETFIIPARAIELIESLPDGEIHIIPEDNYSVKIKTKGINNKFQSYNPEEFPNLDEDIPDTAAGSINIKDLERGIKSVLYAISSTSPRPMLTGVNFDASDGRLNIVGCDGFRVAWFKMDYENNFNFVVPKASVQKLLSVGINDDVEIIYNNRNAVFKAKEYTIYARLLEGKYLDYTRMFVKRAGEVQIKKDELTEAIKRGTICADEKNKCTVKLQIKDSGIMISTNSTISEYTEEIQTESKSNKEMMIGFNALYLMGFLKGFESEVLCLNVGSPLEPMLTEDKGLSAMVLPMRLNG